VENRQSQGRDKIRSADSDECDLGAFDKGREDLFVSCTALSEGGKARPHRSLTHLAAGSLACLELSQRRQRAKQR
jgi:hypothetical protein